MTKLFREMEVLYQALNEAIGVEVEVMGNFQTSIQALYTARKSSPDFDSLQIHKSPKDATKLWIVKNPAKAQAPSPAPEPVQSNPLGSEPLFSLNDIIGDL